MTGRNLTRLAVVRQPERRREHGHVIVGPFSGGPGTPFQNDVASADTVRTRAALADSYLRSDNYIGRLLREEPGTRKALEALPDLLRVAHSGDGTAVVKVLLELADVLGGDPQPELPGPTDHHRPVNPAPVRSRPPPDGERTASIVPPLWDALIALALATRQPKQDPADVVDLLRIVEAFYRARALDLPADAARTVADLSAGVANALVAAPVLPAWVMLPVPGSPADRGVKPAGVADLLILEDDLIGYGYADLSHVENVLRTETKQRTYRRLDRTVDSYAVTTTESEESERDLQTTQRSELQSEINETVSSDAQLSVGVNLSASYGPFVSVDSNVSATLGTSSETSTSVSQSYVQDVVDRSVTKVSSSIQERTVQRVLAETEETTQHGFVNQTEGDIVGYYRWLEQAWRAQIMNYGRRLMIELPAPEPAALWRAARDSAMAASVQLAPPYPIGALTPAGLSDSSYGAWVSRYGVTGVTPPPVQQLNINRTFEMPEREHLEKLQGDNYVVQTKVGIIEIPDGYVAVHTWLDESKNSFPDVYTELRAHVGSSIISLSGGGSREDPLPSISGRIEIAIFMYNFKAATIDVHLLCERTEEAYAAWQVQTFEKIYEAYKRLHDAYQAEVTRQEAAAVVTTTQLPSTAKRLIERDELQRCALTLLTGEDFSDFDAVSGPAGTDPQPVIDPAEAMEEHATVLFHQLAFEWEQMSYSLYPYFWGRKENWFKVMGETDPDLTFQAFLRAGAARVQVPVRRGYEATVLYYLWTGQIWSGGNPPVIGDHLYVPIIEEIAEATGLSLTNAEPYGKPWTYTLPTTLVALDADVTELGL